MPPPCTLENRAQDRRKEMSAFLTGILSMCLVVKGRDEKEGTPIRYLQAAPTSRRRNRTGR
jgi:hypothetical protein